MDIDTATKLIGNLGFPIVVSIFLLWRIEPLLKTVVQNQIAELELLRDLTFWFQGRRPPRRE